MQDNDPRVPALLLCGGNRAARDAAVARLAEQAGEGRSIAVLRSGGMFAGPGDALGPHVIVKRAPDGCACCTAGVLFRVAVLELLRKQPSRLVVDLGPGAHVETLAKQMQSGSLGRALRMVGSIDLDAAAGDVGWPAAVSGG
jgi:G3E family GTPase